MRVKFLKQVVAPLKTTSLCGDVCQCARDRWYDETYYPDEEAEAFMDKAHSVPDGGVVISGLTFKLDYDIVQFP